MLAEVVRSGVVESRHRGSLVVLDPNGKVAFAIGDATEPFFPRSSNKPMQAVGMLRAGLEPAGLSGPNRSNALEASGSSDLAGSAGQSLLALVTASHSGEDFHVDGVLRMLTASGLTEQALGCPPDRPMDPDARSASYRQSDEPRRIWMNCSGKHAGMLASCVAAGWDTESYLEVEHPLQHLLAETIAELAGEKIAYVGVDGCGAPLFGFGLTGLARAFRTLILAAPGSPERRVVDAVRAYPEYASGSTRDEAELIRAVPGLFGKGGAEGCYAAALPDGRAVALKLEDGAARARPVVMAAVLERLGVHADVVRQQAHAPVYGGGRVVGEIRAVLPDLPPAV